jgi:hypothetical protein
LFHAVGQVLQVGADRGDRRLEFVRHVRDEVAARLFEHLELGAHPVEGERQLTDLVAVAGVDPTAVVARFHRTSGGRHVAHRLRHASGQPARDQQRDHTRDHARQQELPPHALEESEGSGGLAEGAPRG